NSPLARRWPSITSSSRRSAPGSARCASQTRSCSACAVSSNSSELPIRWRSTTAPGLVTVAVIMTTMVPTGSDGTHPELYDRCGRLRIRIGQVRVNLELVRAQVALDEVAVVFGIEHRRLGVI